MNGAEVLLEHGAPGHAALVCGAESLDYAALRARVARAGAAWRTLGLHLRGRVAIKLPDGIDWVVAWLGVLWAGGTAVGVNPRVPAAEWAAMLAQAHFAFVLCEADDAAAHQSGTAVIELAAWQRLAERSLPMEAQPMAGSDPAFWVHSSGTSGRPKAVVHAQRSLRGIERIGAERLGLCAGDRLFASSRLFFTYPLVNGLLSGLRCGATLVLDPAWPTPAGLFERVMAMRPSVLFSVPSMLRDLLHEGLAPRLSVAGLRLCVSAGEALPDSLREAWQQSTGVSLVDGYGASETLTLVLTRMPGEAALRPSPGVQVRPLNAAAAAAGAPTRLALRCVTLALGYLDLPAARSENFRHGAFCPADLFVAHPEGGWRFAGREDGLVKLRGRWVDLAALETSLAHDLEGLREAAAVCLPDGDGVPALALFFVPSQAQHTSAVQAALRQRIAALPAHQRPAWLLPLPTLPRTATGKLLRRELRAMLEGQPTVTPRPSQQMPRRLSHLAPHPPSDQP